MTHSQTYAFYPRAVLDRSGSLDLLYLDACCQGRAWHVRLDRYDTGGRRLLAQRYLASVANPGGANSTPTQWAEDIGLDSGDDVVGAYAAIVFVQQRLGYI